MLVTADFLAANITKKLYILFTKRYWKHQRGCLPYHVHFLLLFSITF